MEWGSALVLWHPEGRPLVADVLWSRVTFRPYACDASGSWWRLSDVTPQGWRVPTVEIGADPWWGRPVPAAPGGAR